MKKSSRDFSRLLVDEKLKDFMYEMQKKLL